MIKFWWGTSNFHSACLKIAYICYDTVKWCPRKGCDFNKISPTLTKFTVTDWVVNKDTYSAKETLH